VGGHVDLLTIDWQTASAMPAIVKMRYRQQLGEIIPQVPIDVPIAD